MGQSWERAEKVLQVTVKNSHSSHYENYMNKHIERSYKCLVQSELTFNLAIITIYRKLKSRHSTKTVDIIEKTIQNV